MLFAAKFVQGGLLFIGEFDRGVDRLAGLSKGFASFASVSDGFLSCGALLLGINGGHFALQIAHFHDQFFTVFFT